MAERGIAGRLKILLWGNTFPGNSVVPGFDPRTKILLMIAYIVAVFIVKRIEMFIPADPVHGAYNGACKSSCELYAESSLSPCGLLPLMFVMNLFLIKTGKTIVDWWIIRIYADGLTNAVFVVLRLATLVCGTESSDVATTPITYGRA